MTSKEFEKLGKATRKEIGKKYGFKQRDYLSYKIVDGYFFALNHLASSDAFLVVKPMYADDLWWDIFQCPENKKAPKSLRGMGAFSVRGTKIASYMVFPGSWKQYTEEMIISIWQKIFPVVEKDIESFISAHPNPDKYFPEPTDANKRVNLLYILALLWNGDTEEAADIVKNALSKGESSGMAAIDGEKTIDGYDYIIDWISKSKKR